MRYSPLVTILVVLVPILANAHSPSVYIVIRSQPNSYHDMRADALQQHLAEQAQESKADIEIVQIHKEWPDDYDKVWSILPIMPELVNSAAMKKDWVMFVEDGTIVNVANLVRVLSRFDAKKDMFLARGLFDEDMAIIHHFARRKAKNGGGPFLFPDFEAGWVINSGFGKKVADAWLKRDLSPDFQIDIKHEVAVYFSDTFDVEVTKVREFCGAGEENSDCATTVLKTLPVCDDKTTLDDIFVAVKTTLMFHKDRAKVVMDTWGPKVKNLVLYSNFTDPKIPTIDCGVPNTVRGHCGKTDAILKDFVKRAKSENYKWLFIADDDTIFSVSHLVKFLSCYDYEEPIFLGEKYGYGLNGRRGYAYITGGGGMVFSLPAAEAWVKSCSCPSNDTPDDMILGQCLFFNAGIVATHSPLFHQARPVGYAKGYLSNQTPISFHKHWMVDPYEVYKTWFEDADSGLETYQHVSRQPTVTPTPPSEVFPSPLPPTPLENAYKDEL